MKQLVEPQSLKQSGYTIDMSIYEIFSYLCGQTRIGGQRYSNTILANWQKVSKGSLEQPFFHYDALDNAHRQQLKWQLSPKLTHHTIFWSQFLANQSFGPLNRFPQLSAYNGRKGVKKEPTKWIPMLVFQNADYLAVHWNALQGAKATKAAERHHGYNEINF